MNYTIKKSHTSNQTIFLHRNDLKKFSLKEGQSITLSMGVWQHKVLVNEHKQKEFMIIVSSDVLGGFSLPDSLEYEVKTDEDTMYIGPIIGLLIRGKLSELTKQRIKIYKNYLIDYLHINGLVVLFTSDGIDANSKTIEGFAYNSIVNSWERGEYPFPSAVFLRKTINKSTSNLLNELIGVSHYFNSNVFNKWEMWEWFSTDEKLKTYVPETVLAKNLPDVKKLLNRYKDIYIKPISGMQGTGIYKLSKQRNEYALAYRLNGKNVTSLLENWSAVQYFLRSQLNLDKYIAQQRIPLLKTNRRVMDYRVIVVKDQNGSWTVPGIVTKLGVKDSIVSNISSGGNAEKAWNTFARLYKEDAKGAFVKYKEMETLALLCCETLEKTGFHFGYIGIDIGLDEEKKLWVIEINNRSPDMTIALDADDIQLYYKIKAAPLHYAKWLAGFGGEGCRAL